MSNTKLGAADAIRSMILAGTLSPGNKIPPERDLASDLKMSRGSIREGVRELSAQGVLSVRQGDGTYVSSLEADDLFATLDFALRVDRNSLLHMAELRLILEPHIASLAAARITESGKAALQARLDEYGKELQETAPNRDLLVEIDETIHQELLRHAGNPLIAAVLRSIDNVVRRGRELTVVLDSALPDSFQELQAVVSAVTASDPPRSQAAMTWHIAHWAELLRREVHAEAGGQ